MHLTVAWALRALLALAVLAGCGQDAKVPAPLGDVVVSRTFYEKIPIDENEDFDVLFVIDSSAAMAPFATKLLGNDRELMQLLTPAFGPDLHVGVITADAADAGRLRQTASVGGSFITTTLQFDDSVQSNVTGPLDDAFVALADVGSAGGASVQPLAMVQAALAPGANPGFLRSTAYLVIVIITANDDSSPGAVEDYVTAFKQLKIDPNNLIVSVASGACTAGSLSAPAAPRLSAFVAQFSNRGTQVAVCDDSLGGLLTLESRLSTAVMGSPCIDAPLAGAGTCDVWLEDGTTTQQRAVEPCPSNTTPCWSLVTDPVNCAMPPSLTIHLSPSNFRLGGDPVEEIQCVIQ